MSAEPQVDPIEVASRDEITALQTERLQWTLRHAYDNVARYRAKFDAAGIHPDDFKELADLVKFPTTAKEDLRQSYPFDMFAVPLDQPRIFRTGYDADQGLFYIVYDVALARETEPAGAAVRRSASVATNQDEPLPPALLGPPLSPEQQLEVRDRYLDWASLLKRVFGEDILVCPRCSHRPMRVTCAWCHCRHTEARSWTDMVSRWQSVLR